MLLLHCPTHLTWVEELLCRAHAISDRLIAKLAGLHIGSQSLGVFQRADGRCILFPIAAGFALVVMEMLVVGVSGIVC